ncbi:ABC transporter substrate-binding protein [Corynebacterium choanae]|uniref:ABC transporter substrate-binding protein n=1 Tax=Corynebacterium choanae TaxID=1862358 RepID=UPI0013DDACED|nr:ABC transporter substrate-binding protein [Corynebacterium choanae]
MGTTKQVFTIDSHRREQQQHWFARRRWWQRALTVLSVSVLVASCAMPEPELVDEAEPTTPTSTVSTVPVVPRGTLVVGIDPITSGLNPHLASDRNDFVVTLSDLVLPSAFVHGKLNEDFIVAFSADTYPTAAAPGTTQATAAPNDAAQSDSQTLPADPPGGGQTTAENQAAPDPAHNDASSTEAAADTAAEAVQVAQRLHYEIDPRAQWSDGTPITGNDFVYLWQSIINTPDALDYAAYSRIADIAVSDGGTSVDVTLRAPLADPSVLFTHLLPSHLLTPREVSFHDALQNEIPASAGKFLVSHIDQFRGAVELHRNDRYWGPHPSPLDRLDFVEVDHPTQVGSMLRSKQLAAIDLTAAPTMIEQLALLPDVTVTPAFGVVADLQLSLSVSSPILYTSEIRGELAGLLDYDQIGRIVSRGIAGSLRERPSLVAPLIDQLADVSLPEEFVSANFYDQQGRALAEVPFRNTQTAATTTTHGGTQSSAADPESASDTQSTPPKKALATAVRQAGRAVVIGADADDEQAVTAAEVIADQLSRVGIPAKTYRATVAEATGVLLPAGTIDAFVAWQQPTTNPVLLADRYSCPAVAHSAMVDDALLPPSISDEEAAAGSRLQQEATTTSPSPRSASDGEPVGQDQADNAVPDGSMDNALAGDAAAHDNEAAAHDNSVTATTDDSGARAEGTLPPEGSAAGSVLIARHSNFSGLCDPGLDGDIHRLLAGEVAFDEVAQAAADVANREHAIIPLLRRPRVWVTGSALDLINPIPTAFRPLIDDRTVLRPTNR